jgi:hypothetical protein
MISIKKNIWTDDACQDKISLWASDLPPVFVPVFKLELNPVPGCFVSAKAVESLRAR